MKTQTTNKEIFISFDDTGSMHTIRSRVRRNVQEILNRVFVTDPTVRIGIVAHGDYCDGHEIPRLERGYYLMKSHELSNDIRSLANFIKETGPTGGEGPYAAYEYVLNQARTFNWTDGHSKTIIMIGDEPPHLADWHKGYNLDWKNEAAFLKKMGISVVTVQALNKSYSTPFYQELAAMTGGYHLRLDQFDSISEILEAIAYKKISDEALTAFEEKLFNTNRMNRNLDAVFGTLNGRAPTSASKFSQKFSGTILQGLTPVDPTRFQAMIVDADVRIQDFVNASNLKYKKGMGFYELTKSETIQDYKEIVLQDRNTGDMFTGREARNIVGLPQSGETSFTPVRKSWANQYRVFVQSTSFTRKLIGGTMFMYEIDKGYRLVFAP